MTSLTPRFSSTLWTTDEIKGGKKNSEYLQHEYVNLKLVTNKTTKISHICI